MLNYNALNRQKYIATLLKIHNMHIYIYPKVKLLFKFRLNRNTTKINR